jgi:predicted nucleic acid-binding protein
MAVSVTGKVLLDTNVFIDYLRADLHVDWIFGGVSNTIRFLSSVVLMELPLARIQPGARERWIAYRQLFPRDG